MYKYNCRKCPVRNRCVDESSNSPSIKETIRHAFAARTDTLATWGLLQPNCLLLKAEQKRMDMAPQESMLSRRLRQAREAREQAASALATPPGKRPDYLRPVSPPQSPRQEEGEEALDARQAAPPRDQRPAPAPSTRCWLTVRSSGRHIALPANGELVLGRFDPNFGVPPDVDLAYEDRGTQTISRRHARIVGVDGRHTVEDMGSRHGVLLSEERVRLGPSRQLRVNDRIILGDVELFYDPMPPYLLDLPPTTDVRHILIVASTGRGLTIAPPNDIVIGRSDRYVDFVPDVDLRHEGDVAIRVSRRHALITWRRHNPYLEDLGSGFGTRLNGDPLLMGQAVPCKPGDHIWLGGCVLAYDVEIEKVG